MPSSCGEAQRISNHATSIASAEWSHDGKSIYFLASDRKDQSQIDNEELGDDIFKFEQDFKQRHLWNISIDDYTKTRIIDGDYSVTRFKLSEDGEKILHHRAPSPLLDAALENEIWMMDHDGKNAKQITSNQNPEGGAELSPDNNSILFLSWTNENDEPYFENNLFLTNIKGDKPQQLLSTFDHDIEEAHWSKDGNSIYFNANLGVHNELFKYNISTKEITQLSNGNHTVNNWQYNPDCDAHLMSIKTADNNGDYCICNQIALCLKK
jgi:Tol biopolymer transport system component